LTPPSQRHIITWSHTPTPLALDLAPLLLGRTYPLLPFPRSLRSISLISLKHAATPTAPLLLLAGSSQHTHLPRTSPRSVSALRHCPRRSVALRHIPQFDLAHIHTPHRIDHWGSARPQNTPHPARATPRPSTSPNPRVYQGTAHYHATAAQYRTRPSDAGTLPYDALRTPLCALPFRDSSRRSSGTHKAARSAHLCASARVSPICVCSPRASSF
jgi:hypothetical protein